MWPREDTRPRPGARVRPDVERPDPPVPVRLALDHGCDAPGVDDADLYWAVPVPRTA